MQRHRNAAEPRLKDGVSGNALPQNPEGSRQAKSLNTNRIENEDNTKKAKILSILALLVIAETPIMPSAFAQSKETTVTSNSVVKQSEQKTGDCNSRTIHQDTEISENENENIRGEIINALMVALITSVILLAVFISEKRKEKKNNSTS